jgi:hypothetical protein
MPPMSGTLAPSAKMFNGDFKGERNKAAPSLTACRSLPDSLGRGLDCLIERHVQI